MNYTIAVLDNPFGNLKLDICVSGNKYTVGLWDKEKHESVTETFDSLQDAYEIFGKISSWIIFGLYKDEAKKQYLKTRTMS